MKKATIGILAFGVGISLVTADAFAATRACNPQVIAVTKETANELQHRVANVIEHFHDLIKDNSTLGAGGCRTFEDIKDGIDRKLTLCLGSDGVTYTYELDESMTGATFVKVTSATLATSTTGTATSTTGTVSLDYDALASVIPTESARGQITAAIDDVKDTSKPFPGVKKTETISFTNFLPEEADPHGPQTGTFTRVGEPGNGSESTLTDALIMHCPVNPAEQVASIPAVHRDFITFAGANRLRHARTDAQMAGGQLAAGVAFIEVSCAVTKVGTFELSKFEDASGTTISGGTNGIDAVCDPSFGAVPSLTNNATDYNFSAAVTFPNEW